MREYSRPVKVETPADARLTDTPFARAAEEPAAVMFRRQESGQWHDVTCAEFHTDVMAIARGLLAAGVGHGDRVALMSRTRYEWTVIDYAIWTVGGVTVPVYETSSEEQIAWILGDSRCLAAFVELAEHADRVEAVRADVPHLKHVWRIEGDGLADLRASGAEIPEADVLERRTAVRADDLATLIYTSGTTGRPKGCELTHRNLLFTLHNIIQHPLRQVFTLEGRSTLLFLPLAHSFARVIQIGCVESKTVLGHFPSTGPELIDTLAVYQPTFLLAVPRVFEKVYNKAEQKAVAEGKGRIFAAAAATAVAYSKALDTGGPGLGLRLRHALFSRLVYGKLRAALGGRANHAISGGSALGERLGHFFRGIGLTVIEGYGLTETSAPTAVNEALTQRIGTVGRAFPGVSIRIGDDGEVLVKGDHVMRGYWDNPQATREAFDEDGWYRTGDLGELDDDGYLRITGRKKEIIVTAGGKNVAPAGIEDRIRGHALVSHCIVIGDNRNFVSALITLDAEALEFWKRQNGKDPAATPATLADDPDLRAAVQVAVDRANRSVSRAESVRKFTILPVDFTEAGGQLTASLKVKRHVVTKQFAQEIDAIYAD
ncbi:AMP-dependent synthetase/ligase [Marinitenerispora sediminis]|uniref:Acyl-CoA synthetase n=1 Tax=Marinitenerispora sediminis TaxID=1931232 RepID=A0A368SYQ6_9ACTN|nr:AMP-dependent synthetase/ligase [Marinitenerispora sediminis]RCV48264.1 long-chain fatty acid--CoA ligase [Marinitenerispora sediminis]RCV48355.1 long-chain fatty acid--CoA ligase [Marinitenerispora sediminis]RCV49797.1 long-chain fatty acid--CoA ligase [Marinitenerispora sediminis]